MEELFIQYHNLKKEYIKAKNEYDKALNKKAEYLYSVLPGAANTESELIRVSPSDKLLNYTIRTSEIDKEIEVRRNLADNLSYRLKLKELELKDSKEILDIIYVLIYIKRIKIKHIAVKLNYSYQRIYQLKDEIEEKIRKN